MEIVKMIRFSNLDLVRKSTNLGINRKGIVIILKASLCSRVILGFLVKLSENNGFETFDSLNSCLI